MSTDVTFSALTDVGRKREHNEDNYLVDKKLGLYVVCDGMGGHAAGEVASALAVRSFHEEVKREAEMLSDFALGKTGADRVTTRDILNMLEFAANRASARVYAEAAADESRRGMGTTLVAALICGRQLFVTWVGDSRLYLLRDGVLEQVTEDHNVLNELVKRRKMPREKVEQLAQKNAVTRAIGVYEHAEPESIAIDWLPGDRLLLCSDGLYQYFEDDLDRLSDKMALEDIELAARLMIDAANEAGGSDNITTVLVALGSGEDRDGERARKLQLKRELLARMRLFRPLSDRELLRVLQVTDVSSYENDQVVMEQGAPGEELYIVLEGSVKVFRGDTAIATLAPGDHVGEMALVRNQPRSATVRSVGASELMVIRRRDFFELLRTEHSLAVKLLWQFLGVVADRLAETSRELGQVREELLAEDLTDSLFDDDPDDFDDRPTLLVERTPHASSDESPLSRSGVVMSDSGHALTPPPPSVRGVPPVKGSSPSSLPPQNPSLVRGARPSPGSPPAKADEETVPPPSARMLGGERERLSVPRPPKRSSATPLTRTPSIRPVPPATSSESASNEESDLPKPEDKS